MSFGSVDVVSDRARAIPRKYAAQADDCGPQWIMIVVEISDVGKFGVDRGRGQQRVNAPIC